MGGVLSGDSEAPDGARTPPRGPSPGPLHMEDSIPLPTPDLAGAAMASLPSVRGPVVPPGAARLVTCLCVHICFDFPWYFLSKKKWV